VSFLFRTAATLLAFQLFFGPAIGWSHVDVERAGLGRLEQLKPANIMTSPP
jgi:hypothetical protein